MNHISSWQSRRIRPAAACVLLAALTLCAAAQSGPQAPLFPGEFRSIDGAGNNLNNPLWGRAETAMLRLAPAAYEDGVEAPGVWGRPNPREISNHIVRQDELIENSANLTDFIWQWGQFIDHDITLAALAEPHEPIDIPVPIGDPFFDPFGTGQMVFPMSRSGYTMEGGVRQQVNVLTAFIDGSMVYGSDDARARELRTLDGTGRLKTSAGDLLPFNVNGFANEPAADIPTLFIAGDVRANEQSGLTSMHTLFVREHNHWADLIASGQVRGWPLNRAGRGRGAQPLTDDEIYERARAIVAAEIQVITYREFLPALLGPDAIPPHTGYDPSVNPGIANEFATAAYRVGHTLLSPTLRRIDRHGRTIPAGDLPLRNAFFNPSEVIDHGIDPILRGLASQRAQMIDNHVIDDVRNFLFGPPGSGGFDLPALNLQRGREHGLPSYNQMRIALGLPAATSFADITSDPDTQARFASVYNSVDDVDLWVGGISEDHFPGAQVGVTLFTIISEQFIALRDGDRFWYETSLPRPVVRMVERQSLADIIRRNTGIGRELQDDVFHMARGS